MKMKGGSDGHRNALVATAFRSRSVPEALAMELGLPVLSPTERLESARDYMAELLADAGIVVAAEPVPDAIRPSWVVLLRGQGQLVVAAFVRRGGAARYYGMFERPGPAAPGGTGFASDDDPGACAARVIHALRR